MRLKRMGRDIILEETAAENFLILRDMKHQILKGEIKLSLYKYTS